MSATLLTTANVTPPIIVPEVNSAEQNRQHTKQLIAELSQFLHGPLAPEELKQFSAVLETYIGKARMLSLRI